MIDLISLTISSKQNVTTYVITFEILLSKLYWAFLRKVKNLDQHNSLHPENILLISFFNPVLQILLPIYFLSKLVLQILLLYFPSKPVLLIFLLMYFSALTGLTNYKFKVFSNPILLIILLNYISNTILLNILLVSFSKPVLIILDWCKN